MKTVIDIFDYLKKYHSDMIEVLIITLKLIHFKQQTSLHKDFELTANSYNEFERKLQKTTTIYKTTLISDTVNFNKILKMLDTADVSLEAIEQFINTVTIKRTINKLYDYSTPYELNELFTRILDIQDGDKIYNPCFGIGSLFLSFAKERKAIALYGEELDKDLAYIANLLVLITDTKNHSLYVNNIINSPKFKLGNEFIKFDKIVCNPPFFSHLSTLKLKSDERFITYGIPPKNSPEFAFLAHVLTHMREKAIFLVRTSSLHKSLLEAKMRTKLLHAKKINAVIELPKNILPMKQLELSMLVLSNDNDDILHINANTKEFYKKEGKYNKLINIDKIISVYLGRENSTYSKLTKLHAIEEDDLRAINYVNARHKDNSFEKNLEACLEVVFRGQRVYGTNKDSDIDYYDLGLNDFSEYGFINKVATFRTRGDKQKISKTLLKKFDILIPLRGNTTKVSILGDIPATCVANAGVIVIRLKEKCKALGLYMYLISKAGQDELKAIYENSPSNTIKIDDLKNINVPKKFSESAEDNFYKIDALNTQIEGLRSKIEDIKETTYKGLL